MTLLQALAKSEECDCDIVNREHGLKINHKDVGHLWDLPPDGWELSDTPMPLSFEAEFLGSDIMTNLQGNPLGTVYSFTGSHVTLLPVGTKVKVILEPQS